VFVLKKDEFNLIKEKVDGTYDDEMESASCAFNIKEEGNATDTDKEYFIHISSSFERSAI